MIADALRRLSTRSFPRPFAGDVEVARSDGRDSPHRRRRARPAGPVVCACGAAWLSAALSVVACARPDRRPDFSCGADRPLVASFFLDDIAAIVEREIDPYGARGRPLPLGSVPRHRAALRRPVDPRQYRGPRADALYRARLSAVLPSQWISAGAGVFRARGDAPLFRPGGRPGACADAIGGRFTSRA